MDSAEDLARCSIYIDLNMVRAGVVQHPRDWAQGGYREIMSPPSRYRIIDQPALLTLFGFPSWGALQAQSAHWVAEALCAASGQREEAWSSSLAVGRPAFVAEVKAALGARALHRQVAPAGTMTILRGLAPAYGIHLDTKTAPLSLEHATDEGG